MFFSQFIKEYMGRITDATDLEDMIQEAKANHRVQKLLVPYMAKDRETFQRMLQLAEKDAFAKKLVQHCHAIMHELMTDKIHDREEVKELVRQVNQITDSLDIPRPEVDLEPWELVGYSNAFTKCLLEKNFEVMTPEQLAKRDELIKAFEDIKKRWEDKELANPKNELIDISAEEWIREIEESREEWEAREKREFGELKHKEDE